MTTKNEMFKKLVESNILLEDAKISDFTKSELVELSQGKESAEKIIEDDNVEEVVVIENSSKPKFELEDNFKPVYRINSFKKGTQPVIKISPGVYQYIKSQIHVDDMHNTPVEKQLKSIVYHINTQPVKYITVSPSPTETVRCYLVNGVFMSQRV
jgi:hypothetical protein